MLLVADVRTKLKVLKKAKSFEHYHWQASASDNQLKANYVAAVENRFLDMEVVDSLEEKWKAFQQALVVTAEEVLPKTQKTAKQQWMKQEILDHADGRAKEGKAGGYG